VRRGRGLVTVVLHFRFARAGCYDEVELAVVILVQIGDLNEERTLLRTLKSVFVRDMSLLPREEFKALLDTVHGHSSNDAAKKRRYLSLFQNVST